MLAVAGMAGLAAAVPALRRVALPSPFALLSHQTADVGDELSLATYRPLVGTRFSLVTAGVRAPAVVLEEARPRVPHPADHPGVEGESFSLIFRAQRGAALDDGVYTLVHPALGRVRLFLVAVGTGRDGQAYQAVVDRREAGR
jgi:hypothetical protein